MTSTAYPFIDIAVLDGVRDLLLEGRAVLVLSADMETVLFANAAGAKLAGFDSPFDLIGEDPELGIAARRQLEAIDSAKIAKQVSIRLSSGVSSHMVQLRANMVQLPDGARGIALSGIPATSGLDAIIDGLDSEDTHLAVLGGSGEILAASPHFVKLGFADVDLALIVSRAAREDDRLVKRRLQAGGHSIPAGIGCLGEDPARFLMLAVAELPAEYTAQSMDYSVSGTNGQNISDDQTTPAYAPEELASNVTVSPADAVAAGTRDKEEANTSNVSEREAEFVSKPVQPEYQDVEDQVQMPEPDAAPIRFTWKINEEGHFHAVSPELAEAVGDNAADIEGRSFRDIATIFGFDQGGDIVALLERRDTWSGRSVLWPVSGTALRVPIDLAALPVYDRDRHFLGFRGFGVVRTADAVKDPEATGLALTSPIQAAGIGEKGRSNEEPTRQEAVPVRDQPEQAPLEVTAPDTDDFRGEPPAIAISSPVLQEPVDANIIRLDAKRQTKTGASPFEKPALTPVERSAFREIAERLRRDGISGEGASGPDQAFENLPSGDVDAASSEARTDQDDQSADVNVNYGLPIFGAESEPVIGTNNPSIADDLSDATPATEPDTTWLETPFESRRDKADDAPILAKLDVPVLIHNGSGLLHANPAFFEVTGYESLDELADAGGIEHLFQTHGDGLENAPTAAIVTADHREIAVKAHMHSVKWKGSVALLMSFAPVEAISAGGTTRTSASDGTDKVAMLEREVSELSSVLETATDGVLFLNPDGTIRSINQSAEALFGFDPAAVNGKAFTHLLATESHRAANDYLSNLSGTGVSSLMNDGREVIGREAHGRFIPLFMTVGKLEEGAGYCVVLRDITQWKRAEEDLNAARRAAEYASSQKSEFLARVSHEIRTPLNAIIGFSEMMSEERFGPVGNSRYLDYLRDINRSGRHVLDLVNDLLDISKIEAGQQEMDFESVALNEALSEAVSIMQPAANRERVIIRSSLASDLPEVVADLRSIKQIALNLLSNAVRHTGGGGQVIVSTAYEPTGAVAVRVRDTGIGMSASEIEQAMKPFKQVNTLRRERGDGTGLGLPLTKAMAEANRAQFSIASTPGEGTLVEILFPSTRVLAE